MTLSLLAMPFIVHLPANDTQIVSNARNNTLVVSKPISNTGKMLRAEDFTDESNFPMIPSLYSFGSRRIAQNEKPHIEKPGSDFEPSMKLLSRIMKVILEKNLIGRTALSVEANVNYNTLAKHIEWMENKSLIDLIVGDSKVNVKLSPVGRDFALHLAKFIN